MNKEKWTSMAGYFDVKAPTDLFEDNFLKITGAPRSCWPGWINCCEVHSDGK